MNLQCGCLTNNWGLEHDAMGDLSTCTDYFSQFLLVTCPAQILMNADFFLNCSLTIYVGRDIDFATCGAWKCPLLDWRFSGSMWEFPKKSNPKVSHGHAEYVNQLWLLAPRFREPRKWQLTGLEYNLPDPILWVSMLAFRRSIEEKVSLPFKRGGG